MLLKLQRRKRGNCASEELVHEKPFFSIEAASSSYEGTTACTCSERMVVRQMHRGKTGLAAGTAHERTTNK